MTAETLKPFLTPGDSYVTASHSSASSVHHRSSRYFIVIAASALVIVLATTLLGLTAWNTVRIANIQTEVENLNRVIESMQKRLGLTYLDDLNDLEKEDENNNNLIGDIIPDDDDDDDEDEDNGNDDDNDYDDDDDDVDDRDSEMNIGDNYDVDEEDEDDVEDDYAYDELIKNYSHYDDEDEENAEKTTADVGKRNRKDGDSIDVGTGDGKGDNDGEGNDDVDVAENSNEDTMEDANLYDDFEKFKESKNKSKRERKARSVTAINDVDGDHDTDRTLNHRSHNHKSIVAGENMERRRSPMRLYSSRRRKLPMIKSAKTLAPSNVFNEIELNKPAAHFHLTHKVPYHHSSLRVHTYNGDMYIGKPSWTNERDTIDTYFHVENGVLTVHESGLYYVYAQVCYNNHFAQNGYIIFHGHKPFLQCLSNIYTNGDTVINTCHTSGLIYLKRDDHIHIRDFHADRKAFLEETNNRSYFGLIKI